MRTLLFCSLFAILSTVSAFAVSQKTKAAEESAADAIGKLQKNWDATKSYQSDFKQVVFAKSLGDRDESTGKLYVVKPGKLRWETPEKGQTQIMDGNKLWLVQENKRRHTRTVDVYSDVSKALDAISLSFLSGKSKFKERYTVTVLGEDAQKVEVQLVPKKGEGETLIAEILKPSYLLRSLTTESVDTRVRIDFTNVKANVALDDGLFRFKPKSSDIIHNQ